MFKKNGGFTYVGLMAMLVIIGITTAVIGPAWKTMAKVEKERELIWMGHQFRLAIKRYYLYRISKHPELAGQLVPQFFPTSIDDLLKDPASPGVLRHLRKKYIDPMTGKDDWVLVPVGSKDQSGGSQAGGGPFWGVHSASDAEPLKKDNFDLDDYKFKNKTKYSEWSFEYDPLFVPTGAAITVGGTPGGGTGGGGGGTPGGGTGGGNTTGGPTP